MGERDNESRGWESVRESRGWGRERVRVRDGKERVERERENLRERER